MPAVDIHSTRSTLVSAALTSLTSSTHHHMHNASVLLYVTVCMQVNASCSVW
jgi:hypothetical protein